MIGANVVIIDESIPKPEKALSTAPCEFSTDVKPVDSSVDIPGMSDESSLLSACSAK